MAWVRKNVAPGGGARLTVGPLQGGAGGGSTAPVQLQIRGEDLTELRSTADRIEAVLAGTPGFVDVQTSSQAGRPELAVEVDRARAADLGITGAQVATTVRGLLTGQVATEVERGGDGFAVRVQLSPDMRDSAATLASAMLRTPSGQRVPVGAVADIEHASGPSLIEGEDRQRQVTVLASLEGIPLGDAMTIVEGIAAAEVSGDATWEFGGSAEMLAESMQSMLFALVLAALCVYMILAAQFESFVQPIAIMASLPFAVSGAFAALLLTGSTMSMFAMIGLIMLMGLVTKNAILLVDFANQQREAGMTVRDALVEAGAVRLRPILMTTAAMVFGMLPVAIGHGDGGALRAPMGITVIGGLISSTLLTLLVVPVIYSMLESVLSWARGLRGGVPGRGQCPLPQRWWWSR